MDPGKGDSTGAWICVDGVEGTGKSTIARAVAESLSLEVAPEFSSAPFGLALRQAVRDSPHVISASAVGQSLVFLGDFFEVRAATVEPQVAAGKSVISDRGYLSKYAYQQVILADVAGSARARHLLDEIFTHLPPPDLTIHLTAPLDVLRARLLLRDGFCDSAREAFLVRAAESMSMYLDRNPGLVSLTVETGRPLGDVVQEVESAVIDLVHTIRRS